MGSLGVTLAAYASCNIDGLVVLAGLFAQARDTRQGRIIAAGQLVGIMCIWALSLACALGLKAILGPHVRLLGVAPIAVGARHLVASGRTEQEAPAPDTLTFPTMVLATLTKGADNVGVFAPLMIGWGSEQLAVSAVAFVAMTIIWCWLANGVAQIPYVQQTVERYARFVVPAVLLWIGVSVLAG